MFLERLFLHFYCLDMNAVVLLVAVAAAVYLSLRAYLGERRLWRWGLMAAFLLWWGVIAAATVVSREMDIIEPRLLPFASYMEMRATGNVEIIRSNFMNVVLFFPAGLLFCDILPRRAGGALRVACSAALGAVCSAGIEAAQYFFSLGRAETDDVIHNTLGMLLGALVALIPLLQGVGKGKKAVAVPKVELDREQSLLLDCFAAYLKGEAWQVGEVSEEEWGKLYKLSHEQKLDLVLLDGALSSPLRALPAVASMKMATITAAAAEAVREGEFFAVYNAMRASGLSPMVVKGAVLRSVYKRGELRVSADEDILMPEGEFADACRVLASLGYEGDAEDDGRVYEIGFRKKGSTLYIELHRTLFAPEEAAYGHLNSLFDLFANNAAEYAQGAQRLLSLSAEDNLLYVTLHAYKHFVHSGFGLRQAADMGVWARTFASEISLESLFSRLRSAGAEVFFASVMLLCREYLKIDLPEELSEGAEDPAPLLLDMLSGGIYGSKDLSRAHSASVTLSAVEASKKGEGDKGALGALFPPRERLLGRYPALSRYPWLLPVFWVARIFTYLASLITKKEKSAPAESLRIAEERKALMKRYGIIR